MEHEDYTQKVDQVLSKMPCTLEKAREKYLQSPLFHRTVNVIVSGLDAHVLVWQLVHIIEEERYQKYIQNKTIDIKEENEHRDSDKSLY